jgi:hypothetical protein
MQNQTWKRRTLTPDQQAKRDERRAKFRVLWKTVADMPELQRIQITNKMGLMTADGHVLSLGNMMLIALQCPNASVVGGFRQWQKHGRAVTKGQHGMMIWVPCGGRKNDTPLDGSTSNSAVPDGTPEGDNDTRFIIGTVFDISQTHEIETGAPIEQPAEMAMA